MQQLAHKTPEEAFSAAVKVCSESAKNIQVNKTHFDQYARVPKHGKMLSLFDPVIGLVKL
jgi:hypothetical protein